MLEYASKMASAHHLATQDDAQRLRDVGFSDAEILHVLYWVAHFNMANTLADGVGREVHENMTAVFVDDVPTQPMVPAARDVLRPGVERASVRALEGLPLEWINSPPLTWRDVEGRALVVTVWDAAHPNSRAAVPHLSRWHERFRDQGLIVVGVHAGEFPLSKDPQWAREEIVRLNISYPVALDPTFRRVSGSNNRYWPATHLIDRQGFLRFREYGPGDFNAIESHIRSVLFEAEESGPGAIIEGLADATWVQPEASPEMYATFYIGARGELGGMHGTAADFTMPQNIEPHRLYIGGRWIRRDDGLELAAGIGHCAARYHAREVFVLASPGRNSATLRVTVDGAPVPARDAGRDLDAESNVRIDRPSILALIAHGTPQTHRLDLETDDLGVVIHRFSFLPFRGDVDS